MPIKKYAHVDDFLDDPETPLSLHPPKVWLEKFRAPVLDRDQAWLDAHALFCDFQGKTYRVVGCSSMGDIWLTARTVNPQGYELRVEFNDCSNWKMRMVDVACPIDLDGPWRLIDDFEVTSYHMPIIVDDCNVPVFAAHVHRGVKERIVADHNALVKPFVSPYAGERESAQPPSGKETPD